MPLIVINGKILAGQSLSDGLDCTAGPLIRITMPPEWTPANMTFQLSSDGNGYNDLVDIMGKEIIIPVVPGTAVLLPSGLLGSSTQFIKVRSGPRSNPVPQEADRDFAVAVETI